MEKEVKIIIIDDEIHNVRLLEIIYGQKFYIITGLNAADGLALIEKHPDTKLIISDYRMPKTNGIEFGKKVKEKYPEIPFFVLTGFIISEEIEEAKKNGIIDRYLQKPFNKEELDKAIAEVLN